MKKTIILNAGHSINDQGTVTSTTTEAQEAIKIRDNLIPLLQQNFEVAKVPDDLDLMQSIKWVNDRYKETEDGLALSIHLNASGSDLSYGAEIYYYEGSEKSRIIAKTIIDQYCNLTRFRNRGAKPDTVSNKNGLKEWIKLTKPWACLIECCFIDNIEDIKKLQEEYNEIAWGIYSGICNVYNVKPVSFEQTNTIIKEVSTENTESDIVEKKEVSTELPIFEIGQPNLAMDENTKALREFIDYEFVFDWKTVWLQCTEYVQYKVLKELGIKIDWTGRIGPRNGVAWPSQFFRMGRYKVLDIPKKGCAMSFAAGCRVPPGHVAYVEEVLEDESILISEANWPQPGQKEQGQYNERPLTKEEWKDKYKGKFIDFT